jgi:hypothetical protein
MDLPADPAWMAARPLTKTLSAMIFPFYLSYLAYFA